MTRRRAGLVAAVAAGLTLLLAACTPGALTSADGPPTPSGETIALLLPESKTARYEGVDRPTFEEVVARRCPSCRVLYANADQDAARQQEQAESVLTQGAGVLVLDAVDVTAAASIVEAARERGVTVIGYDRFIAGAQLDYYVSFDSRRVGQLQGEALVRALAESGELADRGDPPGVLLVGGAPTDANSAALEAGVRGAFEGTDIRVLAAYDTPDWSPDKAQEWVAGQLTQYAGRVDAVYAANDGTAGGAISAMKAAGLDPVPPVTGQDAELAAIQRIVSGDQYMTVYKAITEQARTAAELAVRVLHGEQPATTATVEGVPALLLTPTAVTVENLGRVVVDGGLYTIEEICVQPYTRACSEAGLVGEVAR